MIMFFWGMCLCFGCIL